MEVRVHFLTNLQGAHQVHEAVTCTAVFSMHIQSSHKHDDRESNLFFPLARLRLAKVIKAAPRLVVVAWAVFWDA